MSIVLCIDFGTSMSKVAIKVADATPVALELGVLSGDVGKIHPFDSTVLYSSDGFVYFGHSAIHKSLELSERRVDSPKEWLTSGDVDEVENFEITKEFNHTHSPFTVTDTLVLYFAQLIRLILQHLESEFGKEALKTIKYRFTRPVLERNRSKWVDKVMTECITFALRVSTHFPKEYSGRLHAADARRFLDQAYRLGAENKNIDKTGVLEPLAAGTAYLEQSNQRSVAVIVDIGGGTSDLGLFLVVSPDSAASIERAKQLGEPVSIKKAGDFLDSALREIVCQNFELSTVQLVQVDLNIRRWKEDLFRFGETVPYVDGQLLGRVLKHQFVLNTSYLELEKEIEDHMLQLFAESANTIEMLARSSQFPLSNIEIVPVGGGASMPFFDKLAKTVFKSGGISVAMKLNRKLPRMARAIPEFPQLAVAVGGTFAVAEQPRKPVSYRGFR